MKYVKMLGLLAVAAAAMMAFAASASADTVTTTTSSGTQTTPTLHAVSEGHASLHNPEANIECASTVEGTVTKHEAGKPVSGHVSKLLFTGCTNGWTVTTNLGGELTLEALGNNEGTLISHNATVTASFFFGLVTCRYATANTHIGTVTGSPNSSTGATLHIEGKIPFHSGSEACGTEPSQWTGSYVTTEPLHIDET